MARAYSSEGIERLCRALARALRGAAVPGGGFDRIIAVARGGLVPAGLLAGLLEVRRVQAVQVAAYDGRAARRRARWVGRPPGPAGPSGDPRRTLVVDELVDSGATLRLLAERWPEAVRAVLLVKGPLAPGGGRAPGRVRPAVLDPLGPQGAVFAGACVDARRWITFPWTPATERTARGVPSRRGGPAARGA